MWRLSSVSSAHQAEFDSLWVCHHTNDPFAVGVLVQRSPAQTPDEGGCCWQVVDPEIEMKAILPTFDSPTGCMLITGPPVMEGPIGTIPAVIAGGQVKDGACLDHCAVHSAHVSSKSTRSSRLKASSLR